MNYSKRQIVDFLIHARDGKFNDEVLIGALRLVIGLSTEKEISCFLDGLSHEEIFEIVEKIESCIKLRSRKHLINYGKAPANKNLEEFKRYLRANTEELLVLSAFMKVQFDADNLGSLDLQIVEALRRSNNLYADMSLPEIGEHLSYYTDDQMQGVINNVKGIAHEIKFVDAENTDGDNIFASLFQETNHPDMDVTLRDIIDGRLEEVQLKATDSESYVHDWIDHHPAGEIVLTDEIADHLGLEGSGISNADLTYDTEDVVDKLIDASDDDSVWDHFPLISTISLSIVVWSLWRRKQKGLINRETFLKKAAKATGFKIAKIAVLSFMLATPGLGFITGVYIAFRFIISVSKLGSSCKIRLADLPRFARSVKMLKVSFW